MTTPLPPPAAPQFPVTLPPEASADPLASLRDIHLPQAVSFWPLAPGWWGVVAAVAVLLLLLAVLEWRRRQTLGYRALRELSRIDGDVGRYHDVGAVAAAAALLIRRVVVTRRAHGHAAALAGDAWQRFLSDGKAGMPPAVARCLAVAPYLPPGAPVADVARADVIASARRWIRGNA